LKRFLPQRKEKDAALHRVKIKDFILCMNIGARVVASLQNHSFLGGEISFDFTPDT
jgi:hypothetical protein